VKFLENFLYLPLFSSSHLYNPFFSSYPPSAKQPLPPRKPKQSLPICFLRKIPLTWIGFLRRPSLSRLPPSARLLDSDPSPLMSCFHLQTDLSLLHEILHLQPRQTEIPNLGLEISVAQNITGQALAGGEGFHLDSAESTVAEEMENQSKNGVEATKISVLNCIDLSNPDIHQSVSLLKQVRVNSITI
jgi:hypothetical protein